MSVDKTSNGLSQQFSESSANTYDKVIVGGGMAGLQSAYEILRAAKKAGKDFRVAVVADTINSPAQAGSNVVLGLDGYEAPKYDPEDPNYDPKKAFTKQDKAILKQIKQAATHVRAIVWHEKIDCRFATGYQLLGSDTREDGVLTTGPKNVKGAADWLVDTFGYKKDSIKFVDAGAIKFKGYNSAMQSDDIGQINAPEYQRGLIEAIRRMGGTVVDGVNYQNHEKLVNGKIAVHTDKGTFMSTTQPLLATGAGHVKSLENGKLPLDFRTVDTGAMHIQLSVEDAKKVSAGGKPMAYCDTNLSGDVIWGSLDSKGILTMGFGDVDTPATKAERIAEQRKNEAALRDKFREILPDIASKYLDGVSKDKVSYSYGTMLKAENQFPLVGRMDNYDVMVGWASRGIVQSSAAAQAYANYVVNGNDKALRPWESLQPNVFAPQQQAQHTAKPKVATHAIA